MSLHAGSASNASGLKARSARETVRFKAEVAIGATGAPSQAVTQGGDQGYDDNNFTCTRTGAGTYDLAYPRGKRAFVKVTLKSAALTVVGYAVTAIAPGSGTATIKTLAGTNAAVATDPANGDALFIDIEVVP